MIVLAEKSTKLTNLRDLFSDESEKPKKNLVKLSEIFGDMPMDELIHYKIDVNLLTPFKDQPFKPYIGQRFDDMVRSIKELGILEPLIIRPIRNDKKYEILSGNNRWRAAQAAGVSEVPCIIMYGLTDQAAMLIVTESNLIQRSFSDLSHSERAYVLAHHYNTLRSLGKREALTNEINDLVNSCCYSVSDDNGVPMGHRRKTRDVVALEYSLSQTTVARYLRLNKLNTLLLSMIDNESISIRAGVELSYLSYDNQNCLIYAIGKHHLKIDIKIAYALRLSEQEGKLDEQALIQIVMQNGTLKHIPANNGIKLKPMFVKKYFNEQQSDKEVEDVIDKALSLYFRSNMSK